MVAPPKYDNLISEMSDALTLHYRAWVAEYESDDIYAYIIYATPLASTISIAVLTEQGLKQAIADYKTKHGYRESLEQLEMIYVGQWRTRAVGINMLTMLQRSLPLLKAKAFESSSPLSCLSYLKEFCDCSPLES